MDKKYYKMDKKYYGDSRYEKVWEQMELLGIQDVTTTRQHKNGTIVWRLPIKNHDNRNPSFIEVASFSTGYVRNQNSGYSNYQLNKRCEGEPEYYNTGENDSIGRPLYRKFTTRSCKLMPIEIDRLEYLISYCIKNYYIKRANEVANGEYVHKSLHKWELEKVKRECNQAYDCGLSDGKTKANETYSENTGAMARINDLEEKLDAMTEDRDNKSDRIYELESQVDVADTRVTNLKLQYEVLENKLAETKVRQDVSVIVNGHRYKVL